MADDENENILTGLLEMRIWVHLISLYTLRLLFRFVATALERTDVVLRLATYCSLNLVMLADESFLSAPMIPSCCLCVPRKNYVVINSGAYNDSFRTARAGVDSRFTAADIVRTNLDRSGLFGLALTLYYETNMVGVFDVRSENVTDSWLGVAIGNILHRECDIVFNGRHGAVMAAAVARDLLMYTDVKYSQEHIVSVLLNWCLCGSKWRAKVIDGETMQEVQVQRTCHTIPKEFRCERYDDGNEDFAVMIPTYKRDYMRHSIMSVMSQTVKPKAIFILQNRMHVTFNFTRLSQMSEVPLWHIWATNWNSYFFLTYVVMMFIKEKYSLKMDDDVFPSSLTSFEDFVGRIQRNKNTIIGVTGYTAPQTERFNCGINPTAFKQPSANDHVASIVVMPASAGKILHRFRAFTYLGGEDIAVSTTNSIECGTRSHTEPMRFWDMQNDGNSSQHRDEVADEVAKLNVGWIFLPIYCHYIRAGYNPQAWATFQRNVTNIRYPH